MSVATIDLDPAVRISERDALPLAIGSVLRGRFELREVIGRGSMSTVYRALDRIRVLARASQPEVAVKVVAAEGDLEAETIELVHREARYLQDLVHPNIVRGFDSDCDGVHHFVVLELLRGRTLTKTLRDSRNRRLPTDVVARIIGEAAAGLRHAHAKGIVHGDMKPGNVFLTLDGDVKLLDFGAARAMDQSSADLKSTRLLEDVCALTPLYASLEMIAGEPPTESDDVFSLAVLAYVMLTGSHPFDGKTAVEARDSQLRPPAKPSTLSASRWRALQRALAIERGHRTANVAAFAQGFAKMSVFDNLFR
jgi:serine/threonine protein kinase